MRLHTNSALPLFLSDGRHYLHHHFAFFLNGDESMLPVLSPWLAVLLNIFVNFKIGLKKIQLLMMLLLLRGQYKRVD
jgi:hypothetical protein